VGGRRVDDIVHVSLHERPNGLYFYVTAEQISECKGLGSFEVK
jgi:hypothetical protein